MPLTVDHKETVHARARRDSGFRELLLAGAVEHMLGGEFRIGKSLLSDCIAGVGGFEALGEMTGKSPERLAEMFGRGGELLARDLFEVLVCLQRHEGLVIKVSSEPGEVGLIDYTADPDDDYEASVARNHEDDLTDHREDHLKDTSAGTEAVAAI